MHIYVFGSTCRGEIDIYSDIDLLAITNKPNQFNKLLYSIYTQNKITDLWKSGNPFAWHLYWESKLIFSSDGCDFLKDLNKPAQYKNCLRDCLNFYGIFQDAYKSLTGESNCIIYDLSMIFLAIRNIASCYTLGLYEKPNFSRNSAFNLNEMNIPISRSNYNLFEKARILTTRGLGDALSSAEVNELLLTLEKINRWMNCLISNIREVVYE